jgi:HEAT repeat protein
MKRTFPSFRPQPFLESVVMAGPDEIHELLSRVHAADPRTRDLAAAEIADLLEADQLGEKEFKEAIPELIQAAFAERDPDAKESLFNALSAAATATKTWPVDWDSIAERLTELGPDCLDHALVILGFSGDKKYSAQIKPFLSHSDKDVRDEAVEALKMIGERVVPKTRHKPSKR